MRFVLLLAVLVVACGPKVKNQCPGNATAHCVNGEQCSFDRDKGCQVCQCRPFDQVPSGNDPDDPGRPPQ